MTIELSNVQAERLLEILSEHKTGDKKDKFLIDFIAAQLNPNL